MDEEEVLKIFGKIKGKIIYALESGIESQGQKSRGNSIVYFERKGVVYARILNKEAWQERAKTLPSEDYVTKKIFRAGAGLPVRRICREGGG